MRALVQRVNQASVAVDGVTRGSISKGICIFVGIKREDTEQDAEWLAGKIGRLRIFPDESGKMNRSLQQIDGEMLVISQFTLYAETRYGNRPSYSQAAEPQKAEELYRSFTNHCRSICRRVETGVFRAHMEVSLVNDGPVTLLCSSEQ